VKIKGRGCARARTCKRSAFASPELASPERGYQAFGTLRKALTGYHRAQRLVLPPQLKKVVMYAAQHVSGA
jgi:hypothetical protein